MEEIREDVERWLLFAVVADHEDLTDHLRHRADEDHVVGSEPVADDSAHLAEENLGYCL